MKSRIINFKNYEIVNILVKSLFKLKLYIKYTKTVLLIICIENTTY